MFFDVLQLQEAATEEEVKALEEAAEWRFVIDGLPHQWTLQNKSIVVELASYHFGFVLLKPFMDQMREGLETYKASENLTVSPL